jgi:hypothetical protein
MDLRFAALVSGLDDAAAVPEILALLESETEAMLDQLIAYDVTGVLPDRATIDEQASNAQILRAVLEVWRAVHPLAGTLAAAVSVTSGTSFVPPSSQLVSTAGHQPTSIG